MEKDRRGDSEGNKMAHPEHLRGLKQQSIAAPPLLLIHPYCILHHLLDVCLYSSGSVNHYNGNRDFHLLWPRVVDKIALQPGRNNISSYE